MEIIQYEMEKIKKLYQDAKTESEKADQEF